MSENLKVNSKTSILEFKRKHNKLVDEVPSLVNQAIKADKDILSKIKMEYIEEDDVTYITFPKGIALLVFTINTHTLYLLDGKLVNYAGEEVEGYEYYDYYSDENSAILAINGDISEQTINGLDYYSFDGNVPNLIQDTYHLFYPQTGTKLYLHEIDFNTNNIQKGSLIDDAVQPIYIISTRKEPYVFDDGFSISVGDGQVTCITNDSGALFGVFSYSKSDISDDIEVNNNLVGGQISYEQISNVSDTVTEL